MTEFIEVSGGLVEPTRDNEIEWSDDTLEARLAEEVARIAYGKEAQLFAETRISIADQRRKAAVADDRRRQGELDVVEAGVQEELDDAAQRLLSARIRMRELERRDMEAHRVAALRANDAVVREQQQRRAVRERKGVLALLRGSA
jgi:hypothetical protein